jgi:hypothetical protein
MWVFFFSIGVVQMLFVTDIYRNHQLLLFIEFISYCQYRVHQFLSFIEFISYCHLWSSSVTVIYGASVFVIRYKNHD